jgi:hypothetical protein
MKPETLKSKGKAPKAPEKKEDKGEEKGDDKNLSKKDKFKALLEKWKSKKKGKK